MEVLNTSQVIKQAVRKILNKTIIQKIMYL